MLSLFLEVHVFFLHQSFYLYVSNDLKKKNKSSKGLLLPLNNILHENAKCNTTVCVICISFFPFRCDQALVVPVWFALRTTIASLFYQVSYTFCLSFCWWAVWFLPGPVTGCSLSARQVGSQFLHSLSGLGLDLYLHHEWKLWQALQQCEKLHYLQLRDGW